RLPVVGFEPRMVRRLVDVNALQNRMPRRDYQPRAALSKPSPAQHAFQRAAQRLRGVLGDEEVRHAAHLRAYPVLHCTVILVEDRRPLLHVELEDVAGGQPEAEPDGDDAAGRGARDEIEIAGDRMFEMLFQTSQKRGREYAADTAAVERQDAEELAVARHVTVRSVHAASSWSSSISGCIPPPFQSSDASHSSK